jgi:hypothetical protein
MSRIAVVVAMLTLAFTRPAAAFDTWWHAEATRHAMEDNGFSADARLATQVENYITDFLAALSSKNADYGGVFTKIGWPIDPAYDYMHFDAVFNEKDIEHNWEQLQKNTLETLQKYDADHTMPAPFRKIAMLTVLGASLHTVQDFYSHSNWVNYWMKKTGKVPLWYEVDPADRAKLDIHSGAYPDGSAPGHENHADLNKDSSARKLNKEAVEAATRASDAWIKALMASDPTLSWDELKTYSIQNNKIYKDFLERLDATFTTSSSIVAKHFDGENAVKHVFSQEKGKERVQAAAILDQTLNGYSTYMLAKQNKFGLPSPYWSTHLQYHVVRDLAHGMLLAGKGYVKPAPPKPAKP